MAAERAIYQNKVFALREVEDATGRRAYLDHPGSVGIVPLLERDGQTYVVLVRQTRFALGQRLLEIPAGTRDPGEDAETTARRELPEEVGYACGRLDPLGGFYLAPGYSNEYMRLYVARDLRPQQADADTDEVDLEAELVPLTDAVATARAGGYHDAKTTLALLLVGSAALAV